MLSNRGPEMLALLPKFYENSFVVLQFLDAEGTEFDRARAEAVKVLNQFFASRATYTLVQWEKQLKLPDGSQLTDVERQSNVLAHLRGYGAASISLVKAVANSYDNGEVEVVEDFDNFKVIVKFVSTRGIPTNLEDVKRALEAIIPAHLQIEYRFSYLLWYELEDALVTWDRIETENTTGLTWDEFELWNP